MSAHDSIAALLSGMSFAELALLFVVVGGYSLAINGSFSSATRSAAASIAFAAAVAFAALTPSWVGAVAFLALTVVAVAAFAAAAWLIASTLGVGAESGFGRAGDLAIDTDERAAANAPALRPARVLATPAVTTH